jgi:hypothetical protein
MDAADLEWLEDLPCLGCVSEAGNEIRFELGQAGADEFVKRPRTPGGKPFNCCCITHAMHTIVEPRDPPPPPGQFTRNRWPW